MNIDLGDIFITVTVALVVLGVISIISIATTQKTDSITSKVNHIDYLDSYMIVHFKNGKSYNVAYPNEANHVVDFDESKDVTIKLRYSNTLWCLNTNNIWSIDNIIKY